jgi:hypothetical protein
MPNFVLCNLHKILNLPSLLFRVNKNLILKFKHPLTDKLLKINSIFCLLHSMDQNIIFYKFYCLVNVHSIIFSTKNFKQ